MQESAPRVQKALVSGQPPREVLPLAVEQGLGQGSLDEFYRLFFLPLVRRAIRRYGLTFEDAGDVVQDAFVLAVGKMDPARNPKAWLYQVVDYLAANLRRKSQRRAALMARWYTESPEIRNQRGASGEQD
jgi:DNA-directed RNA polymerase specialized sigma24 family protein